MGFYARHILPSLLHAAMRQEVLLPFRTRVVGAAEGRVLEIGIGSGLNLPLYGAGVTEVVGVDPSSALLSRASAAAGQCRAPVTLVEGSAEALALEDRSVDTVVSTWSLCTIPDAGQALAEVRRVLRPGGVVLFVEHGRAPEPGLARWQDRLDPIWTRIAGGCHLNRAMDILLRNAGFHLDALSTTRVPGPRTHTFLFEGQARPG
ncbi:MAG: class I SAM-dependent methyltransferase [Acetobacteraceae bacterium]|nr:class I SAM-dependent methyltransferase [Acetobacteraceae bacterium]